MDAKRERTAAGTRGSYLTSMQVPPSPHERRARLVSVAIAVLVIVAPLTIHSQSGRQKDPKTANNNKSTRPSSTTPIADPSNMNSEVGDDVLRVSSNLVPVPTTVVDSRGAAITTLTLGDFELRVDGQVQAISEISRSETPVRMAMLFDNSGSLSASREFEKHAAVRFFENVLRPIDQAAIYSVSTEVVLSQPMISNVQVLQRTIESFGKAEGSTSLYDGVFAALVYLRPFSGRRVIVIVSDGRDTTSRHDHDFDATLRRLQGDECQVYVVQTGLYDNANVRDLAAERRMQEFAAQTGGAVYIPKTIEDLDIAFAQIAADLAQQYVLSYYPPEDKRDGRYHHISIRVKDKTSLRIRARKGFLVKKREPV